MKPLKLNKNERSFIQILMRVAFRDLDNETCNNSWLVAFHNEDREELEDTLTSLGSPEDILALSLIRDIGFDRCQTLWCETMWECGLMGLKKDQPIIPCVVTNYIKTQLRQYQYLINGYNHMKILKCDFCKCPKPNYSLEKFAFQRAVIEQSTGDTVDYKQGTRSKTNICAKCLKENTFDPLY